MLWKLALTGIKSRLRDYLILFSGLVIASGIFYMFESLATNEDFLKSSQTVSMVVFIFRLGSVLLAFITLIYILYANSFLMTIRQKTYAMFMMLGAKTGKIAQMIFIETLVVGIAATLVGSVVGIGLTAVVNQLLTHQLNIKVQHFTPFNLKALIVTVIFFMILFLLASILNAAAIVKKPILQLLKEDATPTRLKRKPLLLALEAVGGIILLAIGYYMMKQIITFQLFGLAVALVTILGGTYFVFHSAVIFVLLLLKKSENFSLKKLNNFTLSQLSFRIRDYTQILSMVAILFALALGALTVGLGFRNQIPIMTQAVAPYDLVLNNAQKVDQKRIAKLAPTLNVQYHQKEDGENVYYIKDQFAENNLIIPSFSAVNVGGDLTPQKVTADELAGDLQKQDELRALELPEQKPKTITFVSAAEFAALSLPETTLQVIQVKDFQDKMPMIKKLVDTNLKNNPSVGGIEGPNAFAQKYFVFDLYNGMFSGFQFMGFFLGIAFLTMLASCLMFKILSAANSDVVRYQMLRKIGSRVGLLKSSIRREIGVLFLLPGLLGAVHVLFGLQMFKGLLQQPYHNIWLPFLIFIILYGIYYLVTVAIYTSIVLPKENE